VSQTTSEVATPLIPFEEVLRYRASTLVAHREAIERVIGWMRQHLDRELPLEEMARIAHMSPLHFHRAFRRLTGVPPGQFLTALRLEAAKRRLLTTDRGVAEICFEVGYNSVGSFTRRFTRLVGLAPGQLRRLGREFSLQALARLGQHLAECPTGGEEAGSVWVRGRLEAEEPLDGVVFLGLFPTPIPQDRPLACAICRQVGEFRLLVPPEPEGPCYIFAAVLVRADGERTSLPEISGQQEAMLDTGTVERVGRAGPLQVVGDTVEGCADVLLRRLDPLDPPLLVTLPLLLRDHLPAVESAPR